MFNSKSKKNTANLQQKQKLAAFAVSLIIALLAIAPISANAVVIHASLVVRGNSTVNTTTTTQPQSTIVNTAGGPGNNTAVKNTSINTTTPTTTLLNINPLAAPSNVPGNTTPIGNSTNNSVVNSTTKYASGIAIGNILSKGLIGPVIIALIIILILIAAALVLRKPKAS